MNRMSEENYEGSSVQVIMNRIFFYKKKQESTAIYELDLSFITFDP